MQIDGQDAGFIGSIMAALLSVGGFIHKVRSHGKQIVELQEAVKALPSLVDAAKEDMRRKLYHGDGQTVYIPSAIYERNRLECISRLTREINELREDVKTLIRGHNNKGDPM